MPIARKARPATSAPDDAATGCTRAGPAAGSFACNAVVFINPALTRRTEKPKPAS
jgi:hypothetical protein